MCMTNNKLKNSREYSFIFKRCVSEMDICESEADELNDIFNVLGSSQSHEVNTDLPGEEIRYLFPQRGCLKDKRQDFVS